ncbi:MAG: metallophosphoesterase family protein [Treponema sp.]
MKILVTADIHANLEALTAVLATAKYNYDGFISLGDMVGYGPDPEACVTMLRQLKKELKVCILLAGNHEAGVARKLSSHWFNSKAQRSLKKTREALSWNNLFFCSRLKPLYPLSEKTLLVHGSPIDPLTDYLIKAYEIQTAFDYLCAENINLCFCGHTHEPAAAILDHTNTINRIYPTPEQIIHLDKKCHIINPGSVGFPRFFHLDGNPQLKESIGPLDEEYYPAYFLIWNTKKHTVTFKEARYDSRVTHEKIVKLM